MKILWFTWKDREHPQAGGAEVVNEELAKRLVRDGHEVVFIVGGYAGGAKETTRDGFKIHRVGTRFTVYWHAYRLYQARFKGWADHVIDEVNTVPFFARWYAREPVTLFIHQLARQIWFYELAFPFSLVGYLAEPLYLWLLRHTPVITVSESTKRDLERYGFAPERIQIICEGIEMEPVPDLATMKKFAAPTMLALGSIRPMKRTAHIIRAFERAKERLPDLHLIVAGSAEGEYGHQVLEQIKRSKVTEAIEYRGRITVEEKRTLLAQAHVLCVTSVKEGWGLVVTEANSQGTPAVVYDVDGLRDSVRDGETGIIAKRNTPEGLADAVVELLGDKPQYEAIRKNGWEWSKGLTFERGYKGFMKCLKIV